MFVKTAGQDQLCKMEMKHPCYLASAVPSFTNGEYKFFMSFFVLGHYTVTEVFKDAEVDINKL